VGKKVDDLAKRLGALKEKHSSAREALAAAEATAKSSSSRLEAATLEIKEKWGKTPEELAEWVKKEAAELEKAVADMEAKVSANEG
jgi:chromosome segregation ATPase